jgi:eukaryotic-like serine/threonine-protein kinase
MASSARRFTWIVILVVALSLLYAVLEVGFVRPYLSPFYKPGIVAARPPTDAANRPQEWRDEYRGRAELSPTPVWRSNQKAQWARRHVGSIVQVLVFTVGALVLLVLRSQDVTAGLAVTALALSAVAGGGPLFGVEHVIPFQLGSVLTLFAWIAGPLAFPVIALAILYFPARSPLLAQHPWLHAVPFFVALPMLVAGVGTGLYLSGVDGARTIAVWDALHPGAYFAAFAAALAINVAVIIEGLYRYRFNHDANERRRIRMAVYTAVPGVAAFAIKDGAPIVAELAGRTLTFSDGVTVFLQALVLLPAFGLVYAVGVERVLGPRTVLRRSLQYALASRTLTVAAILPVAALVVVLTWKSDQTIADVARDSWLTFLLLVAGSFAAFHFRDRARHWLDQRFFREEYDARKILLSLASRVRFETDPADLSAMVVHQIDAALHPNTTAILVNGIEEGVLTPVDVLHGSAESLPLEGGIVAMLRWSDEPLELFLHDPRSPARRLPAEEQEWLECTGARLLVPIMGQDRSLIAVIAIGEKRSEDAYTSEDRQLLASIAAQMGLGFDVARLRRRADSPVDAASSTMRLRTPVSLPMVECPRCGRCEESGAAACPSDGSPMQLVPGVPRTVDNKYRIEQLIGRGGMGAVYRARDLRLNRLVAVKVVRAELLGDPDARRRFQREAQVVARLQHPAIVSVFDFGTFPDGGAYLVMELVRGEDLRHVLQREGRLDLERALPILSTVCSAIEAAHREGVLHRDLKPENILLPGGDIEAKVLDFGVAKVLDERQLSAADTATLGTAAGVIVGTPAYMAPEQLRAGTIDARTDVFSLGVIAYEMLTGDLPFGRSSLADVVLAHSRGVPAMTGVPASLDRAVRTALHAEPDRRPASPQAFAHLIAAAAAM